MPLSDDPDARGRQLANLQPGRGKAGPGNTRSLVHAGRARVATLVRAGTWAERIQAELVAEAPLRGPDGGLPAADRQVVELLASALARLEAVEAWLSVRPAVRESGEPWPAEDTAGRLRREAARYLDALGMTPRARAALGLDLVKSFDLAQVWAEEADAEALAVDAVAEDDVDDEAVGGVSRPADHDRDIEEGGEADG